MRNTLMRRPTTSLLDDFFNDEFFLPNITNNTHLDVYQEEDKYVVEVDLPGYKKEEIETLTHKYVGVIDPQVFATYDCGALYKQIQYYYRRNKE